MKDEHQLYRIAYMFVVKDSKNDDEFLRDLYGTMDRELTNSTIIEEIKELAKVHFLVNNFHILKFKEGRIGNSDCYDIDIISMINLTLLTSEEV